MSKIKLLGKRCFSGILTHQPSANEISRKDLINCDTEMQFSGID